MIRKKINDTYFDPETNQYDHGTQSANAMAVAYHLADPDRIPYIVRNIVQNLEEHDCHLTTGTVGTKAVIEALCENGYEDVICRMMQTTTSPGFGYMIENGATTLWERWEADDNNNIMNSRNQTMFVQAAIWFYKYLGGLRPGCGPDGVQTLTIFPLIPRDLNSAKAGMELLSGYAECGWKKEDSGIIVEMTVPDNQTADAVLLKKYGKAAEEKCLTEPEMKIVCEETEDRHIFRLRPGKYRFVLKR